MNRRWSWNATGKKEQFLLQTVEWLTWLFHWANSMQVPLTDL